MGCSVTKHRTKEIAIYGKGGAGKSSITANLCAALALSGHRVLQVGCGSRGDSTHALRAGAPVATLLDSMRNNPENSVESAIVKGFGGVFCLETGGPPLGVIWPGSAIQAAIQAIKESGVFQRLELDYVLYDVQGDDAGGGFTVPVRKGVFEHIFTVMAAELKSITTTNALFKGIRQHANSAGGLVGGIIANFIDAPYTRDLIRDYASGTTVDIIEYIPRSDLVMEVEHQGKTVVEAYPDSHLAGVYKRLAATVAGHKKSRIPYPLEPNDLWRLNVKWNSRFVEMETGEGAGASI